MDKGKAYIDYETYTELLKGLNALSLYDGLVANKYDLDFIKEEDWLSETAVIEYVSKRQGTYCIDLLFAHYKDPLKLIIRKITSFANLKKAEVYASIFRRQAAKDQRGTIEISIEDYTMVIYN
jgi:hypothetical protein